MPLLKQHRLDENVVRLRRSSIVIYQSGYLEQIEGCEMAFLTRVSQAMLDTTRAAQRTPDGSS